jgi:ketosteroid isomerase-like protein
MEGEGAVFHGHDGIARWLADLHELYEGIESRVLEVRAVGDQVAVAFVVRGTARLSGITLEQPLAQLVTLRDGKAIEVRDYGTREEAFAELARTAAE